MSSRKEMHMEIANEKDVRNEGNAMFPYEEYKSAIDAESAVRHAGIKAVVQDVEPDENNPACYLLSVKAIGTWDDGSLEEGTVVKDGLSVGDIVSADAEAGLVTVKGKASERIYYDHT